MAMIGNKIVGIKTPSLVGICARPGFHQKPARVFSLSTAKRTHLVFIFPQELVLFCFYQIAIIVIMTRIIVPLLAAIIVILIVLVNDSNNHN